MGYIILYRQLRFTNITDKLSIFYRTTTHYSTVTVHTWQKLKASNALQYTEYSTDFAFSLKKFSNLHHSSVVIEQQFFKSVPCKRQSSINNRAWLRRFDDVTGEQ